VPRAFLFEAPELAQGAEKQKSPWLSAFWLITGLSFVKHPPENRRQAILLQRLITGLSVVKHPLRESPSSPDVAFNPAKSGGNSLSHQTIKHLLR